MNFRLSTISLFAGLVILILWQMLLPGYVLTLDMIFVPEMPLHFSQDGFNNMLPLEAVMHALSFVIPGWVIQKIMLVGLFSCLLYIPYRFLPLPEDRQARLFAALLYATNPFVYVRFIAGHWAHLYAYAFLPLLVYELLAFIKEPSLKRSFRLFGVLFLISIFSVHYFILSILLVGLGVGVVVKSKVRKSKVERDEVESVASRESKVESRTFDFKLLTLDLARPLLIGLIALSVATSYWTIPAMLRDQPLESRFSEEHWAAFSASGFEGEIPLYLNVASLNGFWGERELWGLYFAWPQEYLIFWIGFVGVATLTLFGLYNAFKKGSEIERLPVLILSVAGVGTFIVATGVDGGVFRDFNLWFYRHVPFFAGFRDSQKFSAFLALAYAFLAGLGAAEIFKCIQHKRGWVRDTVTVLVLAAPILFGFMVFGGFHRQLTPTFYPNAWFEAKKLLESESQKSQVESPTSEKSIKSRFKDFRLFDFMDSVEPSVLILPWHGYMSFGFTQSMIIANPAQSFFGEEVVQSKSVELGGIYQQETDPEYVELDKIVRSEAGKNADETALFLKKRDIRYIIHFQELDRREELQYPFLESARFKKIMDTAEIKMYEINEL